MPPRRTMIAAALVLLAGPASAQQELPGPWDDRKFWPEAIAREAQDILSTFGMYTSAIDGIFGPGTRRAVVQAVGPVAADPGLAWAELPGELQVAIIRNTLRQYDAARALRALQEGLPSPVGPSDAGLPQGDYVLAEPARRDDVAVTQTFRFGPEQGCVLQETMTEDGRAEPILGIEAVGRCILVERRETGELVMMRLIDGFQAEPAAAPNVLRILRQAEARAGQLGLPAPHTFRLDGETLVIDDSAYLPVAAAEAPTGAPTTGSAPEAAPAEAETAPAPSETPATPAEPAAPAPVQ